jgi:hypothetical protein
MNEQNLDFTYMMVDRLIGSKLDTELWNLLSRQLGSRLTDDLWFNILVELTSRGSDFSYIP